MSVVRSEVQSDGAGQLVEAVYTFPGLVPEVVFVPIEPHSSFEAFSVSLQWADWKMIEAVGRAKQALLGRLREAGL
jgi:hypothetical protein